jgi:hypothetical protein
MLRQALSGLVILGALSIGACSRSDPQLVQVILPEGDAAAGKAAFADLGCTACHTVRGVGGLAPPEAPEVSFELGPTLGGLSRGALATAVIAPTHVNAEATELWTDWEEGQRVWIGPGQHVTEAEEAQLPQASRMRDYTSVMTVRQLSDLVTFLHSVATTD